MDETGVLLAEAREMGEVLLTSLQLFPSMRCHELDVVGRVLVAADMRHVVEESIIAHAAADDDEGDDHHDLYTAMAAGVQGRALRMLARAHIENTTGAEICVDCPERIEHVYARTNYGPEGGLERLTDDQVRPRIDERRWMHIGGGSRCIRPYGRTGLAQPLSTCTKCKARGTLTTDRTNPWADITTCTTDGCTYRSEYWLGD